MIKLTGGEWNGRPLKTPLSEKTRPTQARLRQALLNSIQFELPGARILDLFSGSGALAFEALSRGASMAILVENSKQALGVIESNMRSLNAKSQVRVISESVTKALPLIESSGPYKIVFADPPYADDWEMKLLKWTWDRILVENGMFCLEWGKIKGKVEELPDNIGVLTKVREKVYGDSVLTHYRRK